MLRMLLFLRPWRQRESLANALPQSPAASRPPLSPPPRMTDAEVRAMFAAELEVNPVLRWYVQRVDEYSSMWTGEMELRIDVRGAAGNARTAAMVHVGEDGNGEVEEDALGHSPPSYSYDSGYDSDDSADIPSYAPPRAPINVTPAMALSDAPLHDVASDRRAEKEASAQAGANDVLRFLARAFPHDIRRVNECAPVALGPPTRCQVNEAVRRRRSSSSPRQPLDTEFVKVLPRGIRGHTIDGRPVLSVAQLKQKYLETDESDTGAEASMLPRAGMPDNGEILAVAAEERLDGTQASAYFHVAAAVRDGKQVLHRLIGRAGTGKSRVVQALRTLFARYPALGRITVVAPSGVAACNVCGCTIHSRFSIDPMAKDLLCRPLYSTAAAALLWRTLPWTAHELVRIYRQQNGPLASLLCNMRECALTDDDRRVISSRALSNIAEDEVHGIPCPPSKKGESLSVDETSPQKLREYEEDGRMLWLSKNAQVMLGTNIAPSAGFCRGALGRALQVIYTSEEQYARGEQPTAVVVEIGSQLIALCPTEEQRSKNGSECSGDRNQPGTGRKVLPLTLAFALTCHKVQGMTLQSVMMDLVGADFARSLHYTAWSRGRSLERMYLVREFNTRCAYLTGMSEDVRREIASNARLCANTPVYDEVLAQFPAAVDLHNSAPTPRQPPRQPPAPPAVLPQRRSLEPPYVSQHRCRRQGTSRLCRARHRCLCPARPCVHPLG
eukprot:TRINITY_DN2268_c0_g1_i11.p2 TRINITY_DN2268_c0_g1~~TRINITY_DN2268_c0_g1_i11.p2  ORF type:complete len:727 (-),score=135.29 TRINITY_DN2268_c0_g1_i11:268-2448(-)